MGALAEGGFWGKMVGAALIAVGTVLDLTGIGAAIGVPLQLIGTGLLIAGSVAGALDPPDMPDIDGRKDRKRPGFELPNLIGDGPIPFVYGEVEMGPVFTQAYITPIDESGDALHGEGAVSSPKQAVTLQCVIGEGPIESIEQIKINGTAIWETVTDERIGVGDGSKKKFTFPRKNIVRESVVLEVNDVQKTQIDGLTRDFIVDKGNGTKKNFTHKEDSDGAYILMDSVVVTYHNEEFQTGQSYKIKALSDRKFEIRFTKKVPASTFIRAAYTYVDAAEGVAVKQSGKSTVVVFKTAPTNGHAITWSGKVENFPDVTVEKRLGEINQPPIEGMNQVRNSYSVGDQLLEAQPVTYSATQLVDDVSVQIAALQGMIMHHRGSDAGKTSPMKALVTVDYRVSGAAQWTSLPNPSGGTEFALKGETNSAKRWEISIAHTLKKCVEKGRVAKSVLEAFTRARYEVRVTRTNTVKNGAGGMNRDRVWFNYASEIQEERLSYPRTAHFMLRAVANERLQGSLFRVTCTVKGRKVENLSTDAVAWSRNPAWCAVDFATHPFGGGKPAADIIEADWITAATWFDESVTLEGGTTETRCQMDLSIDRVGDPDRHLLTMLVGQFAVPTKKGKKLSVYLERARDTDKNYEYSGASANEVLGSLTVSKESLAKTPDEIEVVHEDRDRDHDRQTILIPPAVRATTRTKRTLALDGVTRRSQAIRVGTHILRGVQNQPLVCEFEALPDGALTEPGDVILVKSEIGGWTDGKLFRVLRVGFDSRLRVRLLCREYDANLYAKSTSEIPTSQPGDVPVNTQPTATPGTTATVAKSGVITAGVKLVLTELVGELA